MIEITSQFTDEELTELGRAMERSGHTSAEEFFHWATMQQVRATLNSSND